MFYPCHAQHARSASFSEVGGPLILDPGLLLTDFFRWEPPPAPASLGPRGPWAMQAKKERRTSLPRPMWVWAEARWFSSRNRWLVCREDISLQASKLGPHPQKPIGQASSKSLGVKDGTENVRTSSNQLKGMSRRCLDDDLFCSFLPGGCL